MPWTLIPMPGQHVPKVVDYTLEHGATCIIHGLLLTMYHLASYLPTLGTQASDAQTISGTSHLYIGLLVHNDVNIVVEVPLTCLVKANTT